MLNQCSIKAAETLQRRGEIQGRLIISPLILLPVTRCHLMHFHLQVLISAVSFTTLIVQKDKTEKSPLAQEKSESESSFFFSFVGLLTTMVTFTSILLTCRGVREVVKVLAANNCPF